MIKNYEKDIYSLPPEEPRFVTNALWVGLKNKSVFLTDNLYFSGCFDFVRKFI